MLSSTNARNIGRLRINSSKIQKTKEKYSKTKPILSRANLTQRPVKTSNSKASTSNSTTKSATMAYSLINCKRNSKSSRKNKINYWGSLRIRRLCKKKISGSQYKTMNLPRKNWRGSRRRVRARWRTWSACRMITSEPKARTLRTKWNSLKKISELLTTTERKSKWSWRTPTSSGNANLDSSSRTPKTGQSKLATPSRRSSC